MGHLANVGNLDIEDMYILEKSYIVQHSLRTIKQIELTSRCNLKCIYCPSPGMQREKRDMDLQTFLSAMEWVKHFKSAGTQRELSLTGIGEPLLHPQFLGYLLIVRNILPDEPIVFATNGLLLTEELCHDMAHIRPRIYVSLHRPELATPGIEAAKRYGLLAGVNTAFAHSSINWAGQVDWYNSAPTCVCEFLRSGWGVVLSNGKITTCCMDAEGVGTIGDVKHIPQEITMKPYSLCDKCYQNIPSEICLI